MKKITIKLLGVLCMLTSSIAISQVTANQPQDLFTCDINNPGDGFEFFDLTTTIPEIIGDQTNVNVSFHLTSGDALGNGPGFPNPGSYQNVVNPQLVFVRVQGNGDSQITTFTIEVRLAFEPDTTTPEPLLIFDVEGDGFEVFDLTDIIPQFTNDPFVLDITYYETLEDAQANLNPIADPENYTNTIPEMQTIYVRFQNAPQEECVTIATFEIIADPELSIDDERLSSVKVYPNPSSSVITVENIDLDATITIYDTLGRTVLSVVNNNTTSYSMDVHTLTNGVYFMEIDNRKPIQFIKN
ncbi:T9SS type A sorting domain-containing protein [uncultured Dokdonia sp.]|uniref:T9SS type A sorting domain-containing protein n=1 Tax=uncultured Dokdonia sp. TaxID=575653 RepID=UPI00261745F5|nr:T9SS type A sorting domain-containing protein [uncultured Dokdonia sp.]